MFDVAAKVYLADFEPGNLRILRAIERIEIQGPDFAGGCDGVFPNQVGRFFGKILIDEPAVLRLGKLSGRRALCRDFLRSHPARVLSRVMKG